MTGTSQVSVKLILTGSFFSFLGDFSRFALLD